MNSVTLKQNPVKLRRQHAAAPHAQQAAAQLAAIQRAAQCNTGPVAPWPTRELAAVAHACGVRP